MQNSISQYDTNHNLDRNNTLADSQWTFSRLVFVKIPHWSETRQSSSQNSESLHFMSSKYTYSWALYVLNLPHLQQYNQLLNTAVAESHLSAGYNATGQTTIGLRASATPAPANRHADVQINVEMH
jgi:hypothetical protein